MIVLVSTLLFLGSLVKAEEASNCKNYELDFVIREGSFDKEAIHDDIVADLQKVGIKVNTRFLNSEDYNEVSVNGTYNMFFSETWGAPYDPHSYLTSWRQPSDIHYSASAKLEPPLTREALLEEIETVQTIMNEQDRTEKWHKILSDVHGQAMDLPLYGSRIPYVVNRRMVGFQASNQPYTFPLSSVRVVEGPKRVTVTASHAGMFDNVGDIGPHQYSPNQMFVSDWVYETLLSYGKGGTIEPELATSWSTAPKGSGEEFTFTLRENVTFHDGSEFNCSVVKLNFDHVLGDIVVDRHSWMGLATQMESWSCDDQGRFVIQTKEPYYPLLQELTYVRPLAIAAATSFANGLESDAKTQNSCFYGSMGSEKWDYIYDNITCVGLSAPIGTGPFQYVSRTPHYDDPTLDASVLFKRNDNYWGGAPGIEEFELKYYPDNTAVKEALLLGELDMSLGAGPLSTADVHEFSLQHSDQFDVVISEPMRTVIVVLNTGRYPTDNIDVRKTIMAAVNKAPAIEEEFKGLAKPEDQLLPDSAPYANIDLTPRWDYDLDKAILLNCQNTASAAGASSSNAGLVGGIVAAVVVVLGLLGLVFVMYSREKSGKPMFTPVGENNETV